MLSRVQYGLRAVRRLHHVVLRAPHAARLGAPEQHELGPPSAAVPLRQEAIVSEQENRQIKYYAITLCNHLNRNIVPRQINKRFFSAEPEPQRKSI